MKRSEFEELFSEGWRDPTDDGRRLAAYFTSAIGLVGSVAMILYGIWTLANTSNFLRSNPGVETGSANVLAAIFMAAGLVLGCISGGFLIKEARSWKLSALTMDRLVAGCLLFSLAFLLLAFERMEAAPTVKGGLSTSTVLFSIGGGLLAASFLIGLFYAVRPRLQLARRFSGVTIQAKYAVDNRMVSIADHPCPWADGAEPIVELRLRDGSQLRLRPTISGYESCTVGTVGNATVKGWRLIAFRPSRTTAAQASRE